MKWKKKVLGLLLAMCLMAGMLPMAAFAVDETRAEQANAAALPFTDVSEGDWFYPYVKYAYEHGLMSGTSATTFGPQVAVNRAMVVQILYAQAGKPAVSGGTSFSDVYEGDWYYDAVVWAEQVGVTAGEDGRFNPNTNITREQFALMLYAYIGKPEVSGDLTGFADAAQVSSWAKTGMTWACQNQLFSGEEYNGERYLNPQGQTTRAQAATILKAFCENVIAGMEEEENANYAITDLVVEGQNVTITVSAEQVCTVQVEFLDEDTEQELNVTASAAVPAETELGTVTATTSALLPEHFIARAYLLDADGNQLCNPFTSIKYTSKYEAFAAQTVDDFADEQVVSFTGETDNNFGVLADGVVTETAVAGQNVIAENEDGTYTVTNIDESVQALQPGDEALFYDANGEEVLLSISTITISGTTATIVRDTEATLQDFYQVLKVDMSVGAEPENVDTSEVEGVQLLNRASDGTMEEETRTDQKNIEIIDEDVENCLPIGFGLSYTAGKVEIGGKLEAKIMLSVEMSYDVKLFGEDYFYSEVVGETKGEFTVGLELKGDVTGMEEIATIPLGKIPIPLGAGFSCSISVGVPLEISLEGGVEIKTTFSSRSGCIACVNGKYITTNNLAKKSFEVSDVQGKAKFEIKAGPKLSFSIEFLEGVLRGAISIQAGGAFEAELVGADAENGDEEVHACKSCLDGDLYAFSEAKIEATYQITDHFKGTLFEIPLYTDRAYLFGFYVSLINEEDSTFGGKITFGIGNCTNMKYQTTFRVRVGDTARDVPGAQIDVTKGETAVGTVETGEYLYLYNGSYTARSEVENQPLKKDFAVQGAASTVALNTQTDIETDPPDPDPADVVASGTCGENLTWTLDNNGQLLIKGAGEMEDWGSTKETPWYEHRDQITTVYIGGEVTSIGDNAFWGCSSLTSVTIPDSVTSIGDDAFYGCDSLPSVTIPDSVTSIGDWAFGHCESLTSVTLPDSVTSIGEHAFYSCDSLTSVTIPDSVTSIGDWAFGHCDSLTSVTIPDSVTNIGDDAFNHCDSLTSVTIGSGVTSIGSEAFWCCDSLTSVTIPDSVTSIGEEAFYSCDSLSSVTIGSGVTSIGINAFGLCSSLTEITVDTDNAAYSSLEGVLFNKDQTTLVQYPGGKSGAYTIPDSVTSIGEDAFRHCDSLTSVTIPDSVTSIGDSAFEYCDNLTSVTIPDSVTSIGSDAFCCCESLTSVTIGSGVTSIGDSAFRGCSSLTEIAVDTDNAAYSSLECVLFNKDQTTLVQYPGGKSGAYTIPDSVTSIGDDAFYGCESLTSVTIPDSVTNIGDRAFAYCSSLTSVTIGNGVTSIGSYAFYHCDSLSSVTIGIGVTSIGDSAFWRCNSLTEITVDVDNTAYSSLEGVLFNKDQTTLVQYPGGKSGAYTIPDSVTSIGDDAFYGCESLTSVMISDSVTSIGDGAFEMCVSLTSVTIGNGVTSIGESAFQMCVSLTSVTIGNGVTNIGEGAFIECDDLTDVYYRGSEEQWAAIDIGDNNDPLLNATIHYNYEG